jgi:hypothetical protein
MLAAASYAPAFGRGPMDALADRQFAGPVLGAAAAVAAVCLLLAAGTRLAPVSRAAVAVVVLAGYLLLVVAPGQAVASGPRRLLTSALPIESAGPELATVVVVIGLATLGAVEPALRRRAALLPLLAPLAATGIGCAVSASAAPPTGWLAPGFALGAAALLLLAQRAPFATETGPPAGGLSPGPLRRGLAGGVGLAVLAGTVAAGWYGPDLVPGRAEPADPRQLVAQPVTPREATSPLVLFPALRTGEQNLSLTVYASHPLERLRYISLDQFDGEYWTTRAQYQRAGRQLPLGPAQMAGTQRVERVEVADAGPLGWLVSSGRPVDVSVAGLGVNEQTGDVVLPADLPVPSEYTVRSVLTEPDPDLLEIATPSTAAPDGVLVSSAVGRDIRVQATAIVDGAGYGYPALRALEQHLRSFTQDPAGPGGHGLAQISTLLEEQSGTAEQYASAFAVLARTLGYQSRVVVGFQPRPVEDQPGMYQVTGPTIHAWAEVRFEVLGWVRFDPTPTSRSNRSDDSGDSPTEDQAGADDEDDPDSQVPPTAAADRGGDASAFDPRSLTRHASQAAASLIGLLLIGAAGITLAKRASRRRRRHASSTNLRVLGAWQDTLDRLVETGTAVREADTSGEVVAIARQRFGELVARPVRELAQLYDAAAYAPGRLDASAVEAAWRRADLARRGIREALTPYRRVRAALSPRPLLRPPTRRPSSGGLAFNAALRRG